jgi:hypothetical protein
MIGAMSLRQVDTARIRRISALTYGAAEAYIALGQRMVGDAAGRASPPAPVVRELDHVSEHLLALAVHLARLAAAIEQAGPREATDRSHLADADADS